MHKGEEVFMNCRHEFQSAAAGSWTHPADVYSRANIDRKTSRANFNLVVNFTLTKLGYYEKIMQSAPIYCK